MSNGLIDLISILDLEPLEVNLFRGNSPKTSWQRVFGGQVIGQALVAAARTVAGRTVHSLHAYFMRPGDPAVLVASSAKIQSELGWRASRDLRAMAADAWAFTQARSSR